MKNKIILSSIAAVALLSLSGCGGGGSTPDEPAKKSTISGVAVDDLILNGIVTAKKVNGDVLVTGRTSTTDGSYALNVDYAGVVLLNVTCDADSTMLNPETHETITCGSDVALNSLAEVAAGVDMTVNISPLTEIVYQRATEQAGGEIADITADDLAVSRGEIGEMFGVDPLVADPTEGNSAIIIGAIHTLAEADDSTSVIDVTNALAEELSDGEANGATDVTVVALTGTMEEEDLTNPLTEADGDYTPTGDYGSVDDSDDDSDDGAGTGDDSDDGAGTGDDTDAGGTSDIDGAKALFAELRTQAMSVTDYQEAGTPGFLDTEALSMEEAVNNVVINTEFIGEILGRFADAIEYAEENEQTSLSGLELSETRSATISKNDEGSWSYTISQSDSADTWTGTVTYPEIDDSFNPYDFTSLNATLVGTLPLDYDPVDGVEDRQSFNGTFGIDKTSTGANLTLNAEVSSNGTTITLSDTTATLGYEAGEEVAGETEPQFNFIKLNTVTIQGVVGAYTVDGKIDVNSYVQNAGMSAQGGFTEVYTTDFGGQVYCGDGSNYENGYVEITLDDVTHRAYTNENGYFNTEINGQYDWDDFDTAASTLSFENTCPMGVTPQVNLDYVDSNNDGDLANSGWVPNDLTYVGAISKTGASIEGTLNVLWTNAETMNLESETEDEKLNVRINGKLQMPERPEILLTLTYENTDTNVTVGASYSYDATVINVTGDFDAEMENGDVVVTTHTGLRAELTVANGDLVVDGTGTVTKDGVIVGTVEERSDVPVIAYVDGSFESLP